MHNPDLLHAYTSIRESRNHVDRSFAEFRLHFDESMAELRSHIGRQFQRLESTMATWFLVHLVVELTVMLGLAGLILARLPG